MTPWTVDGQALLSMGFPKQEYWSGLPFPSPEILSFNSFNPEILSFYACITGFPWDSAGKEFTCNEGVLGSIPGLGRSPGEGKGYLLQYSGLQNIV